jgi:DNA (cytosine-5)-methyltransferase 1
MRGFENKNRQLQLFTDVKIANYYSEFCQYLAGVAELNPDEFGKALRSWSAKSGHRIQTIGLFSGAGGLDIGFEDAGFEILENVEIEKRFVATMLKNKENGQYFRNAKVNCIDIRQYSPPNGTKIDFIIGGPPCQSFSSAGRRAAGVKGTNDERGTLFEEYVRILGDLQPAGFLFENVYGILGAQKGEAIKLIEKAFEDVGYTLSHKVLDAADYGTPQHRERLIMVGVRKGKFRFPRPTHGPDALDLEHLSSRDALIGCASLVGSNHFVNGRFGHLLVEVPNGLNYSYFTSKMGHPNPIFAWRSKFSDFLYKADPDRPIRTLKASGGQYTGPFHWDGRRFTVNELKRLQTFPDDYEILGGYGLATKQLGNSVPPQFARILALAILDQVFQVEMPIRIEYLQADEQPSFRGLKRHRTVEYRNRSSMEISTMSTEAPMQIKTREYQASLSSKFELSEDSRDAGNYRIKFEPGGENWMLNVSKFSKPSAPKWRIIITDRRSRQLFGEVKAIHLGSDSFDIGTYSVAWKALERELSKNSIKADLVQLNGYYQTPNPYDFSFESMKPFPEEDRQVWEVIQKLLVKPVVGRIEPSSFFSESLDIVEAGIHECFIRLRRIGYEIRNSSTNSEIPVGSYLIPYRIPTLSHRSVQLNKKF